MERVTDGELVELARGGDTAAFGDLVSRHKLTVYRTALAALGSPADAEDVAQDAFIQAFQNLGAFRGEASVKTWIVRIAWRLALTRRRSVIRYVTRTLRIDAGAPETIQSPEPSAEVQLGDAETVARVRRLIRALPSRLRDPLLLSMNPDMTSDGMSRGFQLAVAATIVVALVLFVWLARRPAQPSSTAAGIPAATPRDIPLAESRTDTSTPAAQPGTLSAQRAGRRPLPLPPIEPLTLERLALEPIDEARPVDLAAIEVAPLRLDPMAIVTLKENQ